MPCESPGIIPIDDDCCFTCYNAGRLPYNAPIAIVLHEYDGHIEQLNNEMESCCNKKQGCHTSFHYGVGHDGSVRNWVDPSDASWSFYQQECGGCGWDLAEQESLDPNLFTVNIALATGISSIQQGQHQSSNVFTDRQYDVLVRLVGWLAETYSIPINQNTIWRHCDELDDFPESCPTGSTFSDFLQDVEMCIEGQLPDCAVCDCLCDSPVQTGPPAFILGLDENCESCGRYSLDVCTLFQGLPIGAFDSIWFIGLNDNGDCIRMQVGVECNITDTISSAFGLNSNGVPGFYPVQEQIKVNEAVDGDTLDLTADERVILLDASQGNVVYNLAPPPDNTCVPWDIWIKRIDCNTGSSVTINGGGNTIDGVNEIFLGAPAGPGNMGEAVHLIWVSATNEWIVV